MKHTILSLVGAPFLCALAACSSTGRPAAKANLGPLAPFPYTPEEIRDANPPGTEMVYVLETVGAQPTYVVSRFVSGDAHRTVLESSMQTASGTPVGDVQQEQSTWTELQRHASFPASATTRSEARRETPAGAFDCWLYTVRGLEDEIPWVKRLWFAKDKPGSPVYFEEEHGGEKVMSMTLLEFTRAGG